MRHTEGDLRKLLTEQGRERAHGPSVHLDAIVKRGHRTRRIRRAVTAGAAVAFAVIAVGPVSGLLTGPSGVVETMVAQRPVDSARVDPGPKLPETFPVVLGANKFDLSLIHSQRFETEGVARTVTFTPSSFFTGYKVVCDDPRAWVVISHQLKGGESGGAIGRCDGSVGGHHDRLSAPSNWLKRPQSLQVWVFPADAPVREVAKAVTGCKPILESKGCDERAQSSALGSPEVRERLTAEVGEQPGEWAVGIYDRPAAEPVPNGEPPKDAEPSKDADGDDPPLVEGKIN
ncbi:hypothetical protein [Streptosporangium lutulentum]|uniref:Uncharacterized protein n=1 Tax=Streptosporangium lutulentum TaxID=1461250 RepID=A0ABT9QJW8_9ACTN|nr:hypothetical protein [Streptosporangium lutulentum]MDP9847004.1 hypothetical protein [Streptosporangium lutulentum]